MAKYRTTCVNALIKHQQIIERSLADFASGRNTEHLPAIEIDQVIRALEKRLEAIKQSLARSA